MVKEKRRYWKLKEEALDGTLWRICCGRGYGSAVRLTREWMSEWMWINFYFINFNSCRKCCFSIPQSFEKLILQCVIKQDNNTHVDLQKYCSCYMLEMSWHLSSASVAHSVQGSYSSEPIVRTKFGYAEGSLPHFTPLPFRACMRSFQMLISFQGNL